MKWLLAFFPLYLLLLSGIPCSGNDTCCQEEVSHHVAQRDKEKDAQHKSFPCSPFFACRTCQGLTTPPELNVPVCERPQTGVTSFVAYYQNADLPDYPTSIFQPPRVFQA